MDRPRLEVADVSRRYGEAYREQHGASMSTGQRRVMTAIEVCRTAALGGHMERCDECGHERNAHGYTATQQANVRMLFHRAEPARVAVIRQKGSFPCRTKKKRDCSLRLMIVFG